MDCSAGGLISPKASGPNDHNCNECIFLWVSIVRLRHTKLGFLRPSGAELGGAFVEFSLNSLESDSVFNGGGHSTADGLQLIGSGGQLCAAKTEVTTIRKESCHIPHL